MKKHAVNIAGIQFENPFILASAPPTAEIESIKKAFDLGWAGAVLKTISPDRFQNADVSPRFAAIHDGSRTVTGFENIELLSKHTLHDWKAGITALKKSHPSKVIVASIMAPLEKNAWQNLVRELQQTPVDAFELNFSCPHGMPEKGVGMAIGTDPELSSRITRWVKETATVPVFVKLSPNVTDIAAIARAVQHAGADGISAINTVSCLIGVDLETLTPLPDVAGHSAYGGYSGPAVKPIGLKCVAQIHTATGLPILAIGGIKTWRDAAEYIALGGNAVQICTAVMVGGYRIIRDLISGLENYMAERGLASLTDLHGAAAKKITTHGALSRSERHVAVIDSARCRACRKCVELCSESGYSAIVETGGGVAVLEAKCDGCGLCACACSHRAVTMRRK